MHACTRGRFRNPEWLGTHLNSVWGVTEKQTTWGLKQANVTEARDEEGLAVGKGREVDTCETFVKSNFWNSVAYWMWEMRKLEASRWRRSFTLVIRGTILWTGNTDGRGNLEKIMNSCWTCWIWVFFMVCVSDNFVIKRRVTIDWFVIECSASFSSWQTC